MCEFCAQHGDGKTWYLRAENYVGDLNSDLARREYVLSFVREFDRTRSRALVTAELIRSAPAPLARLARREISRRQQRTHFGQPVPIEDCESIFEFATSIVRLPCVCRTYAGKAERGVCLAVTTRPVDGVLAEAFKGFEPGPDIAGMERLTQPEAMQLLRDCEREGLMHSVWTFQSPLIAAICNCDLASGCMAMRLTVAEDIKMMWRGEYVAQLDPAACTACGACVERCPFEAIDAPNGASAASIRTRDCWGCGVCRSACTANAIMLTDRRSMPEVAALW